MRKKLLGIHQSGKGSKTISYFLSSTNGEHMEQRWGFLEGSKMTPSAQRRLIHEVTKEPRVACRTHFASVEVSVRDSTTRKKLACMVCLAKFHNKNHCWRTRTYRLVSILPENICQEFWGKKKYSVDWRKFDFLEGHYINRKSSTAFQKRVFNGKMRWW